jgi:hypothetical protein
MMICNLRVFWGSALKTVKTKETKIFLKQMSHIEKIFSIIENGIKSHSSGPKIAYLAYKFQGRVVAANLNY